MDGEATPAQIGGYLIALRMKGETVAEIAGSAHSMRKHVIPVAVVLGSEDMLVDTCGTGGDGKHTFNISTTAAFIVAGAGLKVAKHGNRAASSRSGSADLLMALGGNLDLTPEQVGECIEDVGIGFLYAIHHHPAMRHSIGPRRELGQRTIFNLLGPLTNPAGATHQLMGVYDPALTTTLAGVNRISVLRDGDITTFDFDPASIGLPRAYLNDLLGGTPEENAAITREILGGYDRGPRRDIVLLNAAAALSLESGDWRSGLAAATEALDNRAALQTLDNWVAMTNSLAKTGG
jgi:anthranilate phosphoribosyltransferase